MAGATGYDLWRYDGAWAEVGAGLTGTSYTDTGLTTGQTYYYAVAAVNARGRGPWSDNKRVTLSNDAGDPTPTTDADGYTHAEAFRSPRPLRPATGLRW